MVVTAMSRSGEAQAVVDDPRRLVPLSAVHNFRDLGGYPSRFGGSVRWGRLYRADRLDALTVDDLETISGLGLTAIYDLRTMEERTEFPDAVPSTHVPIFANLPSSTNTPDLASIIDHDGGVRFMTEMCVNMVRHASYQIGAILFTLADASHTPMMFHCTAGKDRTGVVAAIMLEALGVDREVVLDDFELTARFHRPEATAEAIERLVDRGLAPEAVTGLLGAPRSMMAAALHALDDELGGVDRYLTERGGLDRDALEAMRRHLIVGSPDRA